MADKARLLEMKHVSKAFPGVKALDDVHFDLAAGEVHVLMGENGAGKSTLMKILSGFYTCDEGEILIEGERAQYHTPHDAINHGVAMIYQELNPVPHMTIAENVFLGKEPKLTKFGLVDVKKMNLETASLLAAFDIAYMSPSALMKSLSVAETQMIEIIKAYSLNAKILIMDEPTSALSEHEVNKLFEIIGMLKQKGVGIVYISHKMDEIWRCADRITVFRDGKHVGTRKTEETSIPEIIRLMVGRDLKQQIEKEDIPIGEVVLSVENLSDETRRFQNVSFQLYRGEILGIAGLMGADRSEVVETIFGIRRKKTGVIKINGKPISVKKPVDAMRCGIALVGEDRKLMGLNLKGSVRFNVSLCVLEQYAKLGVVNNNKEITAVDHSISTLRIKTPGRDQKVAFLSGGNQQKVVVAKWLLTEPDVFIMDEPTRGIDVGSKKEIYQIITDLARRQKGIIMVSSELPEILGLCDRVLVLHEGNATGVLTRDEFCQEKIMLLATGGEEAGA